MDFMKDGFLQVVRDKNPLGSVCGYYLGIAPRIRISDPEILKQIMIKEFHPFPVRQTNSYLNGNALNNGLVSVEGDQWKRIRITLTPTFASAKLKGMLPILNQCIKDALTEL